MNNRMIQRKQLKYNGNELILSSQLLAWFPHDLKFQAIANGVQTDSFARRRTSNIYCTVPQVDRSYEGRERIQTNSSLTLV